MLYFFIVIQNEKKKFPVKVTSSHTRRGLRELSPLSVSKCWDINLNLNLFCAKLP